MQALLHSAASGPSDAARAAAHAALAALPLSAATLAPLLLAGAGSSGPPSGGPPGEVPETPAAARQGKRARKAPTARSKAAPRDPAGAEVNISGTAASEGTRCTEGAAQLSALLELLHWKTDVLNAGALLAPLCVVLRALGMRAATAPRADYSADGDAGPGVLADSTSEGARVSAQGYGHNWFYCIICCSMECDMRAACLFWHGNPVAGAAICAVVRMCKKAAH